MSSKPSKDEPNEITEWRDLGIQPPRLQTTLSQIKNVIILNNPIEVYQYIELLKTMSPFKWEDLKDLEHTPGTIHHVLVDKEQLTILDVDGKPKDIPTEKGIYDVSFGKKVEEGPGIVRYFGGRFAIII